MKATLTKISKKASQYGGYFYYAYFKTDEGDSYYTCLSPKKRNFQRWKKILRNRKYQGIHLSGLKIKKGNLIDADSNFKVVEEKIRWK